MAVPPRRIDEDEAVRDAAMRELSEEIGTRAAVIVGEHPDWLSYDLPSHLIGVALGGAFRGQNTEMGSDALYRTRSRHPPRPPSPC